MKSNIVKMCLCAFFFIGGMIFARAMQVDYISFKPSVGAFSLSADGRVATICVDTADYKGVRLAARNLGTDIGRVTGTAADVSLSLSSERGVVVAGTIGRNRQIDEWVKQGKLDVSAIEGKWESYLIQTVDGNLVIAGSDQAWYYFRHIRPVGKNRCVAVALFCRRTGTTAYSIVCETGTLCARFSQSEISWYFLER